ncbi:hypothetical protein F511_20508 [Dorcoceras hygrometricum]|uniref:Uncharacterized protein n=1 Tax=Dorcoceras hygrometricum TaxID=472368 RepID=A0A2Z7CQA0_9LAMI|nr:hypothetical protein F511_20508 [Dorcoceras hygrometricum]
MSPLYHGLSTEKSSVRDHQGPSARHRLGGRHSYPVVTAPTIALDFSGTTNPSTSHNVAPNLAHNRKATDLTTSNIDMFKLKAAKGCSIRTSNPQNSTSQSRQGTADLTACEQISPSFKITKPKISGNKSVQGINYKNKTQIYEKCSPKNSRKPKIKSAHYTSKSRTRRAFGISQLVAPSFQTSINGKSKSQGVQRHSNRQKLRLESTGNGD